MSGISTNDRAAMIRLTEQRIADIKSVLYGPEGRNLWCGEADALWDRLRWAEEDLRDLKAGKC
jgi:hypothetical protein